MFNNFTSEKQYCSCNVVISAEGDRGALLIGDFNSATDEEVHRKYNIKTIITSAAGLDHLQIPASITHIIYPLRDAKTENIHTFFAESYTTIDRKLNEGGVLVHCAAGVSRSATLVIAYLMRKNELGFKSAITFVRSKRSGICPNLGFQLQLKKYETELTATFVKDKKMKKNISERTPQQTKSETDLKKLQNSSFFQFDIKPKNNSLVMTKKKPQIKKGIPSNHKHMGYSRPKEKKMVDVSESELFISGKGAQWTGPNIRESADKFESMKKNPMLGTWAPKTHTLKQFEF